MTINDRPDSANPTVERAGRRESVEEFGSEPTLEGIFAEDGVDLSVIRWMLERTPEERLEAAQQLIDAAWVLRADEA